MLPLRLDRRELVHRDLLLLVRADVRPLLRLELIVDFLAAQENLLPLLEIRAVHGIHHFDRRIRESHCECRCALT